MKSGILLTATAITLALGVAGVALAASAEPKQSHDGIMRRLSPEQYRNVVSEVFGPSIDIGGRFEPDTRVDNLVEVGAARVSVSSDGMAQFDIMARTIAEQVVSARHRAQLIPCTPAAEAEPDDVCARQFLDRVGTLLFRRPLTASEQARYVEAAKIATKASGNFYTGLSLSLAGMLESPQFLFRQSTLENTKGKTGEQRLDAYSKATRLSFFLWNTLPDDELMLAARRGDLHSAKGLEKQVDRMMASPRLEGGVRAFFQDMLHFDEFEGLVKDSALYPKYDSIIAANAQEQTLRTIIDVVVRQRGDYRDIFTTRKTYLTQALASVYDVPLVSNEPVGYPDVWQPYEFAASDPRAGILTHVSFAALHGQPGRSSPTLRGKALREIMLCQKVPAPPADVKFELVQDTTNPIYRTARDRLTAHRANPVCAGCHKLIDPMGLALENFDGSGAYRTKENGVVIDTTGELDGKKFTNAAELGQVVHDSPAAASCVIDRLSAYALGRTPTVAERPWVDGLKADFAKTKYVLPEIMRRIALSPAFFQPAAPLN